MKLAILSNGNANYSTKRLVEEAEKRGHDVKVIKYKNCYLALDDKHPDVYYKGKKLMGFDAILPRISNNMTRYGCAVVRQFEMQGVYTSATSVAITRARDKPSFHAIPLILMTYLNRLASLLLSSWLPALMAMASF